MHYSAEQKRRQQERLRVVREKKDQARQHTKEKAEEIRQLRPNVVHYLTHYWLHKEPTNEEIVEFDTLLTRAFKEVDGSGGLMYDLDMEILNARLSYDT